MSGSGDVMCHFGGRRVQARVARTLKHNTLERKKVREREREHSGPQPPFPVSE